MSSWQSQQKTRPSCSLTADRTFLPFFLYWESIVTCFCHHVIFAKTCIRNDGYRVFPPKWRWFIHSKSRSRSRPRLRIKDLSSNNVDFSPDLRITMTNWHKNKKNDMITMKTSTSKWYRRNQHYHSPIHTVRHKQERIFPKRGRLPFFMPKTGSTSIHRLHHVVCICTLWTFPAGSCDISCKPTSFKSVTVVGPNG